MSNPWVRRVEMVPHLVYEGDCLKVMSGFADASIDAIVTDPPYGLSFMGKRWDYDVPSVEVWAECLRVLKPGGHLLAFAGTRTQHRMAVRIEDAGFEIRDMIAWVYGSGFPKSLDVSKAIGKAAGAEREKVRLDASRLGGPPNLVGGPLKGNDRPWRIRALENGYHERDGDTPATDAARQWQGWGTALKPALEPITVARKPLDGTVAANVLAHGTGAINVDGCRIGMSSHDAAYITERLSGFNSTQSIGGNGAYSGGETMDRAAAYDASKGRWPANLIHDGSDEVVGLLGDAARFFYCAKASKADRDEGCEGLEAKSNMRVNAPRASEDEKHATRLGNHHPTVKPADLMRYLCRLVTPPGGIVLDPFMGSGSTGVASVREDFRFVGIELDPDYIDIGCARIRREMTQPRINFLEAQKPPQLVEPRQMALFGN